SRSVPLGNVLRSVVRKAEAAQPEERQCFRVNLVGAAREILEKDETNLLSGKYLQYVVDVPPKCRRE
ncbi:MAG: hypothetical protein ACODAD_04745, partial [Planctomycetota bacterium]